MLLYDIMTSRNACRCAYTSCKWCSLHTYVGITHIHFLQTNTFPQTWSTAHSNRTTDHNGTRLNTSCYQGSLTGQTRVVYSHRQSSHAVASWRQRWGEGAGRGLQPSGPGSAEEGEGISIACQLGGSLWQKAANWGKPHTNRTALQRHVYVCWWSYTLNFKWVHLSTSRSLDVLVCSVSEGYCQSRQPEVKPTEVEAHIDSFLWFAQLRISTEGCSQQCKLCTVVEVTLGKGHA